jgi:hypothetical protein
MPSTYQPIATQTLGSATASITFSSIPNTYTDLVLVVNAKAQSSDIYPQYKLNTSSTLSRTYYYGDGSTATSGRSSDNYIVGTNQVFASGFLYNQIVNFMNYANTTTYKTVITRSNNSSRAAEALVSTWRSTAAITTIEYYASGNFDVGSTFTLYGIKAA